MIPSELSHSPFVVILCTAPDKEAPLIARSLVEEGYAACINVLHVESYYKWMGDFCQDKENLLIIKTKLAAVERVMARIKELHSYELPEMIVIPIVLGYDKYLEWISNSIKE